jgi:hypothetical protein
MRFDQSLAFILSPFTLVDVRVKMVLPSLMTLLPKTAF